MAFDRGTGIAGVAVESDISKVAAVDTEIAALGPVADDIVALANALPFPPVPGDVNGPASSSDNDLVVFDGITGKLIKSGNIGVDPSTGTMYTSGEIQAYAYGVNNTNSGNSSFPFGYNNTITNDNSYILGKDNQVSGARSFIIGDIADISGSYSYGIGYDTAITGDDSYALGEGNVISGNYGLALGHFHDVSGDFGIAIGAGAVTRGLTGALTYSTGYVFAGFGTAQTTTFIAKATTTNNTPEVMTFDGSTAGTTNQIILPNDSTYFFSIHLVARRSDGDNESAAYKIEGCIDRNGNAASTALVGTPVKTVLAEDNAAWDVSVSADTTNGGLAITVTGENSKEIYWLAKIETVEVVG